MGEDADDAADDDYGEKERKERPVATEVHSTQSAW